MSDVIFQTEVCSWVLATPTALPALATHPSVLEAAGGRPASTVQLADVAVVDFAGLQVSCVQAGPQRYHFSVAQSGGEPSARFRRTALALFSKVLEFQPGIALGLNFLRVGVLGRQSAGEFLLSWFSKEFINGVAEVAHPLRGAGTKFLYQEGQWRVSLGLEPKSDSDNQLVANVNFEVAEPTADSMPELIGDGDRLYRSFLSTLEHLVGVGNVAAAS